VGNVAGWILAVITFLSNPDFWALVRRIVDTFERSVLPEGATNAQLRSLAVDMALQTEEAKLLGAGEWVAGQAVEIALLIARPSRARNVLVADKLEEV